jgi:hypothetical protein
MQSSIALALFRAGPSEVYLREPQVGIISVGVEYCACNHFQFSLLRVASGYGAYRTL